MRFTLFLIFILISSASLATEQIHFRDLYGRGGEFSQLAKEKQGQTIRVRGYMAPPIKAQAAFFVLTKMPMSFCPFCESEADWPTDIMLIKTDDIIDILPYNQPIYVTGQLDIGPQLDPETGFLSRVRLLHAQVKSTH
ncbi:MAG: hypothetical protein V5786_03690 [Psychromonas sp.]